MQSLGQGRVCGDDAGLPDLQRTDAPEHAASASPAEEDQETAREEEPLLNHS